MTPDLETTPPKASRPPKAGPRGGWRRALNRLRSAFRRIPSPPPRGAPEDARYRRLFDGVPIGLYLSTWDGTILDANPAMVQMLGYPDRDSLLAVNAISLWVNQESRHELLARLEREEVVHDFEMQLRRHNDSRIWVRDHARVVRDESGRVLCYEGSLEDITEHRHAEDELRLTNERLRSLAEILEATPDLVGISTVMGKGIYLNPAGRRILGITEEQVPSPVPIWEFHPEPHRTMIRDEALPVAIRDGIWSGEVVFRALDGRETPTSMVMVAHGAADGKVEQLSVIARDLTEQKALEEHVRHAEMMNAIARLAGGIAHDFNNLLTSMLGHSDLLLSYLDDPQSRADVSEIKKAAERAASLTSHLLAFSRRRVLRPKLVNINEVIRTLAPELEPAASNVTTAIELADQLPQIETDPLQMEDVIEALVENACEAMPEGGRLTIRTESVELRPADAHERGIATAGRYVVLSVIDTGRGMDEETQALIFEPFFSTKKEVKGTGLGLATVYGIVKQSGGDVWVESEPGRGTNVSIYLPAHEDRSESPGTATTTILLAEDEPSVLNLAARVLRDQGYTVLEARDGLEALSVREGHPGSIDLLITDVVMPRIGGPELAEQLQHAQPGLRVLYISGYRDNQSVRKITSDPTANFLHKPFTPAALSEMVRRILRHHHPES